MFFILIMVVINLFELIYEIMASFSRRAQNLWFPPFLQYSF
ncbi:hypothetical protein XBKB1_1490047 [Xenorhabdus bovienii str. kraussei Becker Underwood]|uniref:Uncharacterized protein n=1 Tax=Xenorhabdus bovienii str. kraussei Becker Underwood TaxID=1398204 RepID=A0A077PFK7_XENBV|nr:hypothetical protein XBKB1_1490047 [Xenorhabdus bovienii str. kraussei Becker Underwood]